MIKLRGGLRTSGDAFESSLLAAQVGPALFEALWCESLKFSESDWQNLASEHSDVEGCLRGTFMLCAARVPVYLCRLRAWKKGEIIDALNTYITMETICQDLATDIKSSVHAQDLRAASVSEFQFDLLRNFAFHLTLKMMLGCILQAIKPDDEHLQEAMEACAEEMVWFARTFSVCKPLAASILPMALSLAWSATTDTKTRVTVELTSKELMRERLLLDGQYSFAPDLQRFIRRCRILRECNGDEWYGKRFIA